MPLTSISDELDRLRLATPDCRMTAFGDLRARLVLTWSAEGPCPRETLDAIAAEAARAFALSGLIDDSSETLAITFSESGTRFFARHDAGSDDVVCADCAPGLDIAPMTHALHDSARRIAEAA
ncbi:hypothetical protein [Arenibacterium halophilum]|jgi:hypothetical protein|uniref:Uncharacterized protein n=1 Tax=Arenibacterium halophilum TaxID=2583821 RepID=A0ABY2X6T1_9RHOB|nr:hypothetical protein [Arenibacterium halophilum]MAY89358.1 hypothetical protein [Pseudooceanicola sp.]TMV11494.1 hypothetical protein FGK64_14535 [Arenibacterium halophilum]